MNESFTKHGIDSPRLCAEILMAHVIGCERLALYTDADRPASPLERETLRGLVRRAMAHEPIQYLVGEAWFYGIKLKADRRALIPRPETEILVEQVCDRARSTPGFVEPMIVDLCTGSGCVAIAIAKHVKDARVVATDISAEALSLARENATSIGVDNRIEFIEGDLFEPVRRHPAAGRDGTVHAIVSNPPYIPDHEWDAVEPNVKDHEPALALRGGADGLELVRPILDGAPALLRAMGLVLIELADSCADAAVEHAKGVNGLGEITLINDHSGQRRVLRAIRSS